MRVTASVIVGDFSEAEPVLCIQLCVCDCVLQFYRVLNIRVALVGLEVWSDSDKCSVSQDPFTTLHEFLDWRKLVLLPHRPHDNAQLIR